MFQMLIATGPDRQWWDGFGSFALAIAHLNVPVHQNSASNTVRFGILKTECFYCNHRSPVRILAKRRVKRYCAHLVGAM